MLEGSLISQAPAAAPAPYMPLFVGTEFAARTASELVLIALASEDGAFESTPNATPFSPSDFVRGVAYPLLDRGDRALPDEVITKQLHALSIE